MEGDLNQVVLRGNLGVEPDLRYTPQGLPITRFDLATSQHERNHETGEEHNVTQWHHIVLFDDLAEIAGNELKKGDRVYIEGALKKRKWKSKNGYEHAVTEVIAHHMKIITHETFVPRVKPFVEIYQD